MKNCPACDRPFQRNKRYCYACQKPILARHRWHCNGCWIQHDNCANPTLDPAQDAPLLAERAVAVEGETPA